MSSIAIAGSGGGGRTTLTADTTYYVAKTGSNSNPGTITQPWATIQFGCDFIMQKIDIGGFQITLQVEAGTYVEEVYLGDTVGLAMTGLIGSTTFGTAPRVLLIGDDVTPDNVFISYPDDGNNGVYGAGIGAYWELRGFHIECQGNTNFGANVVATFSAVLYVGALHLGPSGGADLLTVAGQGFMSAFPPFGAFNNTITVTGGGDTLVSASQHGFFYFGPDHLVITGTPNFSNAAAVSFQQANMTWFPGTMSGASTGLGYKVFDGSELVLLVPPAGNAPGTVDASSSANGLQGPFPGIDTQTASYTLALTDASEIVEMNVAGANTVTVPTNATVAFPVGIRIKVVQTGAGATTIAGAVGVTVHNAGALSGQWGSATLYQRATDEWVQTT